MQESGNQAAEGAASGLSARPGDELGGYVVKEVVAGGRTGVLFRCCPKGQDQEDVLVKVLHGTSATVDARGAVLDSIRSLRLPGVAPVKEVFEIDGRLTVARPFMSGMTLASYLERQGPLTEAEAVELGRRLCRTVHRVHQVGLAHHDIRPGHLFVPAEASPREALLLDLGSPSSPGDEAAPELFDGQPDATQTDVYGICATLSLALGRRPSVGAGSSEERPAGASQGLTGEPGVVSTELNQLLQWGLSSAPWQRPPLSELTMIVDALSEGNRDRARRALKQATTADREQRREGLERNGSTEGTDDRASATLRIVKRWVPERLLRATGFTESFFVEGEKMEQEFQRLAEEEAEARRELLWAWFRFFVLLLVVLAVAGGVTWALLR